MRKAVETGAGLTSRARILRPVGRWRGAELTAHQDRCLERLVRHAWERVPFYRARFEAAGVTPADIRSAADIGQLPPTEKVDLQQAPLVRTIAVGIDPRRLVPHWSSGRTGEPLTVRRTGVEENLLLAFRIRVLLSLGLRLSDRRVALAWMGPDPVRTHLHQRLGLLRRTVVPASLPAAEAIAALRRVRPDILGGLPGVLVWLCGHLDERDREWLRPRLLITGGEASTSAHRRLVAESFGAPVLDHYGSNEFNLLAWECPSTGSYHVADPTVLLEVRREGRPAEPGEDGEVFATALFSYAMPFIRYRLGDIARRGPTPCPCGAPWSTIGRVLGRVVERFVRPDGSTYHPWGLGDAVMLAGPWVQGFQFVQVRRDKIRLRLCPKPGCIPAAEQVGRLLAAVKGAVDAGVEVVVELIAELPPGSQGKSRPYVCDVTGGRDGAVDREAW